MEPIAVQTSVSGFSGKPCTLLSLYDPATGVMRASKLVAYETERRPNALVIGTDLRMDLDAHFTAELLGEAINAYEAMAGRIDYAPDAQRAKPDGQYQTDGFDERGPKRRIEDGLSNDKVAMLATCWGLQKQDSTLAALDCIDQFTHFNRGGSFDDVRHADVSYVAFTV